jgi:hypothetical protein
MRLLLAFLALLWTAADAGAISQFPPRGVVIAADYGAKCDGSHDDAAAINAALAVGGHIILPSGVCMVSVPISTGPAILSGAGQGATIIKPSASMATVIDFNVGNGYGRVEDFDVVDTASSFATALINFSSGTLDAAGRTHPIAVIRSVGLYCGNPDGILVNNPSFRNNNLDVDGIWALNCTHAFHINAPDYGGNSFFRNSRTYNGGVLLEGASFPTPSGSGAVPQGIRILNNNIFPLNSGPGVEIRNGLTFRIEQNIIDQHGANSNCIKLDTTVIPAASIQDVDITNNFCGGVSTIVTLNPNIDGILMVGSPYAVRMSGNWVYGWTGYGVSVNGLRISLSQHFSSTNTNGDINLNTSNASIFEPRLESTVGIATSGGVYCLLGGSVAGTLSSLSRNCGTVAFTDDALTWTKHQAVLPVALTDGSSIAVNGTDANAYTLTIAGNSHTLACPSTVSYGTYAFRFLNSGNATGFAVNSCYHFGGGTQPPWSTATGKVDVMFCQAFNNSTLECSASIDSR